MRDCCALRYFTDYEREPAAFSRRYVALLKNGFNDTPAALEKRFLGIDLHDEAGLVADAGRFIETKTDILSQIRINVRDRVSLKE